MVRCQTRSTEPSFLTPLFYQGEFLILSGRKLSRVGQVFQNSPPSNTSIRNSCRRSFYLLETYHSKAAQWKMLCGQAYRKVSVSTLPSAGASFLSSASVFALVSATSRWLDCGSSVSFCCANAGKAKPITNPAWAPSKRIFHCLLLGFENDRRLRPASGFLQAPATSRREGSEVIP